MKIAVISRLLPVLICFILPISAHAAKTVKIMLTGTANEKILMTIGNTGRTEVISDLPYKFEVPKDQMPVRLTFQSEHYLYYSIDVPRKPVDTTGHVYLVKVNESAMAMRSSYNIPAQNTPAQGQAQPAQTAVTGLDVTRGVNAAPVTGHSSENTFALIIANEDYDMAAKVDNAINDGTAFKEYCIKTLGIPAKNVKFHTNLTFGKMRKALNDILDICGVLDGEASLVVYYAGHGIPDNKTKNAFLMPVDADGADTEICVPLNHFYERLNSTPTRQSIVFLDACFSGAQRDGEMIMAARGVKLKPQPSVPKGNTIVFSATSGDEAAYSYKDEEHGVFTYFLLKKLQESKGRATLGDLADYLSKNVGMQSRLDNHPQTPTVSVAPSMADKWKSLRLVR